jgi:hypothetical protein
MVIKDKENIENFNATLQHHLQEFKGKKKICNN